MARNHRLLPRQLARLTRTFLIASLLLGSGSNRAAGANPEEIHLTVAQERGAPIDSVSRWLEFLQPLRFASLRLRTAQAGDQASVTTSSGDGPPYQVMATITRSNDLELPGARIRLGDQAALTRWMNRLGPKKDPTRATSAFGLTDRELISLRARMNARWESSTHGVAIERALASLHRIAPLEVTYTATARDILNSASPCAVEVQGISLGTALAALLRPHGLVWAPVKSSNDQIEIQIAAARERNEAWPIGWPLKQPSPRVMPKLMEKIEVEITATPLDKALSALQSRLDAPFLVDHNGLAAQQIDLTKPVQLSTAKASYKRILDRLLFQALLEFELRQDESDRPLLWIQPIRR